MHLGNIFEHHFDKLIQSFRYGLEIVEECGDKYNGLKIQFTTSVKLVTQPVRFTQRNEPLCYD
jgi:hypothetical protein